MRWIVLVVLAACGDNRDLIAPDAAAPAEAPDAPSLDAPACTPHIAPADGATRVGVFAEVAIDLPAPPDSAVEVALLAPHTTVPAPATVTIDGCRVTIRPKLALAAGATYRVRAPGFATSFTTVVDPWVRRTGLSSSGAVNSGELHEVDALGRTTRQTAVSSVGPDGLLGTADDHVFYLAAFAYVDVGTTRQGRQYWPGPDAILGTADDKQSAQFDDLDDPEQPYTRHLGFAPGPDGLYDTADDVIGDIEERGYAADGRLTHFTVATGVGPDGLPFTADDVLEVAYVVDDTQTRVYDATGLVGVTELVRDADDHIVESREHSLGPDDTIGTADDGIDQAFIFSFDPATGVQTRWQAMFQPGPDGIWLSADDVAYHDIRYSYDAAGNLTRMTDYNSLGNPDDIIYYAPIVP